MEVEQTPNEKINKYSRIAKANKDIEALNVIEGVIKIFFIF